MTFDQIAALIVLVAVVGVLIHGKARADVTALCGAAALLLLGVVRPVEVQAAFASPAIIALAALFVIAYAIELTGLLGLMIRNATRLCARLGARGLWLVIGMCGLLGGFLNNTPVVVLAAPVVRDVARSLNLSPKRFLMPLSHISVMGGLLTLIGTSTNLLVNDMARNAGQPVFGLFEITPVGLVIAGAGAVWLYFVGARQLGRSVAADEAEAARLRAEAEAQIKAQAGRKRFLPFRLPRLGEARTHEDGSGDAHLGDVKLFSAADRPFEFRRAMMALAIFLTVVIAAGLGLAPIAASAFAGAVALILLRILTADEAYAGLRPDILLLIAGMVVIGIAIEVTGLAGIGADAVTGGEGNDSVNGNGGNDDISGGNGNDTLFGGGDQDVIQGGDGNDSIYGQAGDDDVGAGLVGGLGADLAHGGGGNDLINGNDDADSLYGGAGNDFVYGGNDADYVHGGSGNDVLYGQAGDDNMFGFIGADTLNGGEGNDRLNGGDGNDTLRGGGGNDVLTGGRHDDSLWGEGGTDRFNFDDGWGHDVINDFANDGLEKISLAAVEGIASLADLTITNVAGGALVTFGSNSIEVVGVTAAQLDSSDFIL